MTTPEPDEQRAASRRMWERAAERWGSRAELLREYGMPVSVAMIEALDLQPGQRVLELGRLAELLDDGGFQEVEVVAVAIEHRYDDVDRFIAETVDMLMMFDAAYSPLDAERQLQVRGAIAAAVAPFQAPDGSLLLSGSSLVASATA